MPKVSRATASSAFSKKRGTSQLADDSHLQGCRTIPADDVGSYFAIELFCRSGNEAFFTEQLRS